MHPELSAHADGDVSVPTRVVQDNRLSFRASGLLLYLLSCAEQVPIDATVLAERSPREGREAIATALRQLISVGYVARQRVQYLDGSMGWISAYSDAPARTSELLREQLAELPDVAALEHDMTGGWPADTVPAGSVAYVLTDGDRRDVYVGSTSNIAGRLEDHAADKNWTSWRAYRCPSRPDAYRVEYALIALLQPPLNRADLVLARERRAA